MKIWLDDVRVPSSEWIWCKTSKDVIHYLVNCDVSEISLDHDLGLDNETGYDVLTWLEQEVFTNPARSVPKIYIHSANPVGRKKMLAAIAQIEALKNRFGP
jgi:hypothetical protein